jgi:hypothetical protein
LSQVGHGVEDQREVPLLGTAHSEAETLHSRSLAAKAGNWEKISTFSERGGRISARAFPEFFLGLPGSGSVVNHYYCMQISMQIPHSYGTPGKFEWGPYPPFGGLIVHLSG